MFGLCFLKMIVSKHNEPWTHPVALLTYVCGRIFNILLTVLVLSSLAAGKLSSAAQLMNITFACWKYSFRGRICTYALNPRAYFDISVKQEKELPVVHLALFIMLKLSVISVSFSVAFTTVYKLWKWWRCSLQIHILEMLTLYFKYCKHI